MWKTKSMAGCRKKPASSGFQDCWKQRSTPDLSAGLDDKTGSGTVGNKGVWRVSENPGNQRLPGTGGNKGVCRICQQSLMTKGFGNSETGADHLHPDWPVWRIPVMPVLVHFSCAVVLLSIPEVVDCSLRGKPAAEESGIEFKYRKCLFNNHLKMLLKYIFCRKYS